MDPPGRRGARRGGADRCCRAGPPSTSPPASGGWVLPLLGLVSVLVAVAAGVAYVSLRQPGGAVGWMTAGWLAAQTSSPSSGCAPTSAHAHRANGARPNSGRPPVVTGLRRPAPRRPLRPAARTERRLDGQPHRRRPNAPPAPRSQPPAPRSPPSGGGSVAPAEGVGTAAHLLCTVTVSKTAVASGGKSPRSQASSTKSRSRRTAASASGPRACSSTSHRTRPSAAARATTALRPQPPRSPRQPGQRSSCPFNSARRSLTESSVARGPARLCGRGSALRSASRRSEPATHRHRPASGSAASAPGDPRHSRAPRPAPPAPAATRSGGSTAPSEVSSLPTAPTTKSARHQHAEWPHRDRRSWSVTTCSARWQWPMSMQTRDR